MKIDLIISICAVVVAGVTLLVNMSSRNSAKNMEKRDLKRYAQEIDSKARDFILKYHKFHDAHLSLLYECVMAYNFDPSHTYYRQIYNDFIILSDDVKKRVLEIRQSNLNILDECNIIEIIKTNILQIVQTIYPNEDRFVVKDLFDIYCNYSLNYDDFSINFNQRERDCQIMDIFNNNDKPFSVIKEKYATIIYDKKELHYTIMASFVILAQQFGLVGDEKALVEDIIDKYSYDSFVDSLTLEDEFLRTLVSVYMFNEKYINYLKGLGYKI